MTEDYFSFSFYKHFTTNSFANCALLQSPILLFFYLPIYHHRETTGKRYVIFFYKFYIFLYLRQIKLISTTLYQRLIPLLYITVHQLEYRTICMMLLTLADHVAHRRESSLLLLHTLSSDPTARAPHRIRGAVIPQEYDLARLVENMEGLHPTWRTNVTACAWKGVSCNLAGDVTEIHWGSAMEIYGGIRGSFGWRYLPLTLTIYLWMTMH